MTLSDSLSISLVSVARRKVAIMTSALILAIALTSFTLIAGFVRSISAEIDRISSGLFASTIVLIQRDSMREEMPPLEASLRSVIAESHDAISEVNGWSVQRSTASIDSGETDITLYGIEGDFAIETGAAFAYGNGFTISESAGYDLICVLGANAAASLGIDPGSQESALSINVNGVRCDVRGILQLSDNIYASRFDRAIIVPLRSGALYLSSIDTQSFEEKIDSFTILLSDADDISDVRMQIDRAVRRYYGIPQNLVSPIEFLDGATPRRLAIRQRTILQELFVFTGVIAFLSGLLGYAASLYYFFVRRVREFAIRQAVGASPVDIFIQAISEAVLIGVIGGLSGAAVGMLSTTIVSIATDWGISVDLALLGLTGGVGILSGVVLGVPTVLIALRGAPAAAAKVLA